MTNRYVEPLTDEQRAATIQAARSYWRVPFRHQGRTSRGVDCAGLLVVSLRDIGIICKDVIGYGRMPYRESLEGALAENFGELLPRGEMRVGDIALFQFNGEPNHVGIVTDHPDRPFGLIHSFAQTKMVVEHGVDATWMQRMVGVYRL